MGNNPSSYQLARDAGDMERARELRNPAKAKRDDAPKCGARTTRGTNCVSGAGQRTDHPGYGQCYQHGGNTEAGIKGAMRLMGLDLIQRYKADYVRFGGSRLDPDIATMTPESALLEEVRRSAAMVRFLEERIALWNLSPEIAEDIESMLTMAYKASRDARLRGDAQSMENYVVDAINQTINNEEPALPALVESHQKTGIVGFTDSREWLTLYREERGHLARVSKMCIDAGVASRLVTIAEDQGRILSSAIRVVLMALNLTPDQQALVPVVVPQVLRAVAADAPIPNVNQLLGIIEAPRREA